MRKSEPDSKYVSAPDSILVGPQENFAPAFPIPVVTFHKLDETGVPIECAPEEEDCPAEDDNRAVIDRVGDAGFILDENTTILDLDGDQDAVQFTFMNRGGSHTPTGVRLDWVMSLNADASFLSFNPFTTSSLLDISEFGNVASTLGHEDDIETVFVNRDLDPGPYIGQANFFYVYGSTGLSFSDEPVYISYVIAAPELTVTTPNAAPALGLDFGLSAIDLQLVVENTGQSSMAWALNLSAFPSWLLASEVGGTLKHESGITITVTVFRDVLVDTVPSGETQVFPFDLIVSAPDLEDFETVPITLTVSNP